MTDNPVILITRPEPQASRFAEELRAATHGEAEVVVAPLLAAQFFGEPIEGNAFTAAVFTSETGVTGAARLWRGSMGLAFAVGDRTAEAATALGWLCDSAKGAGPELAARIAASGLPGPMVWPKGCDGGQSLIAAARELGLEIVPRVVYAQDVADPLPGTLAATRGRRRILPVFSPRSAQIAREHLAETGSIEVVAISPAAAEAWGGSVARVAERPDGRAMTQAILAVLHQATT